MQSTDIPVTDVLRELLCVLSKHGCSLVPYNTESQVSTWHDFKKHFRNLFVAIYDRVDFIDDLHKRK